ncbi:unnamed protein product [Rotaria sp. Silwood1]|nr:unnamed protein product [Rotaria sp. Silwood1]
MLTMERGLFYHINLSLARNYQFNRILRFLPLNDIQSLAIDSDASPLQLTRWPYLPRLKTLRIIGVYNHNDLLLFLLLHAATLIHLIIKSNERLVPDGYSFKFEYPIGDIEALIENFIFIHLPALRSLDVGMNYYGTRWFFTTAIVSLTYLRIVVSTMDMLVRLMSTTPLSTTLHQLHVKVGNSNFNTRLPLPTSLSIRMVSLHIFTLVQTFFSMLTIEWVFFEMLTSSNVMPVLRRANMSIFIDINDINCISSSSLFTDHRHVDVHFAFSLINCPRYVEVTQYIPRGNRFRPREIVGATFVVNYWRDRSQWEIYIDPFKRGRQYDHHMWYTLPWAFDEFYHEYLPHRWITKTRVFEIPQKMMTIHQSTLRTLDTSGQTLPLPICSLPYMALSNCIETLHLSYYNTHIPIYLSAIRNITLVNSINCLNYSSSFPTTIRCIRILLFYYYPNYISPNWPVATSSIDGFIRVYSVNQRTLIKELYVIEESIDLDAAKSFVKIAWNPFEDYIDLIKHSPTKSFFITTYRHMKLVFVDRITHHVYLSYSATNLISSVQWNPINSSIVTCATTGVNLFAFKYSDKYTSITN